MDVILRHSAVSRQVIQHCSSRPASSPAALWSSNRACSRKSASHSQPVSKGRQYRDICPLRAMSGSGGFTGGSSGGSGGVGVGGGGSSGSGSGDDAQSHPMRLWTFLYAALLAAGGVMAYVKKGSTKSLTSALGSALILGLSARTMAGAQVKGSLAVCLAIAVLLSVIMSGRYSRTKKVMPAGVTAGISLAMSAAYLGFLFQ